MHPFGSEMDEMRKQREHESKCQRCGVSCHVQMRDYLLGDIVVEGMHCKFLVKEEGGYACSVYAERYEKAPWCHSAEEAAPLGMLRVDCPYNTTGLGKRRLSSEKYDEWWKNRRGEVLVTVHPHFISTEAFLQELCTREPGKDWEVVAHETGGWVFQEKGKRSGFLIVPVREATG